MPNTTLKLWLQVWTKMQNNNRFITAYPLVLQIGKQKHIDLTP